VRRPIWDNGTSEVIVSPLSTPLPWDLVAEGYAEGVTPTFAGYAERALDLAGIGAGASVLDVACGPGTLSLRAAARGCEVDALDFSAEMVARLRAAPAAAGVRAVCGDGQALPFDDASFDAAFSMFGVIFFPDRAAGLRELRRVVRPGGAMVVSSWPALDGVPQMAAVFASVGEVFPGGSAPAPALATPDDLRHELAAAGWRDVVVHTHAEQFEAPDAATFWAGMERTLAPLALMRHTLGDKWPRVRDRIGRLVVDKLGDGAVVARMPAWIAVGRPA
jgi:SAM-dependent methyltransferase